MTHYLFATNRSWNVEIFSSWRNRLPGTWQVCIANDDLAAMVQLAKPRFVFFPHWSHIVPGSILDQNECVCFHMTDLPFGRGGSPLQNLISRGYQETHLTALRMTSEIDSGPVYLKHRLDLSGTAEEIFRRAAELSMQMIEQIVTHEPKPAPQIGEPVFFKRRTPEQSRLPELGSLADLFDHIRMLDAPGYPHAFLQHGNWTGTITDAKLQEDTVEARIRFKHSDLKDSK